MLSSYLLMSVSISGRGPLAAVPEGEASSSSSSSSSKYGAGDSACSQPSSATVYLMII